MGENSRIAWTNHTYNPFIGCTEVGVGCVGCYARTYDERFLGGGHWGAGAPRFRTSETTRRAPERWNLKAYKAGKIARVFAHSLSDVFDNEVPDSWRHEEFKLWQNTPYLRWIVLTKRPGNILKMLPHHWDPVQFRNVGFCCSVSTQEEFDREIPKLARVRAAWLGVSIEPQVERIRFDVTRPWMGNIKWIITGGASAQPHYNPPVYDVDWARSLISQCADAGIACFVKQLGANPYDGDQNMSLALADKAGADPEEWPADVIVQEFPDELLR